MKQPEWDKPFGRKYGGKVDSKLRVDPTAHRPFVRDVQLPPTGGRYVPGACAKVQNSSYTGTSMIGIAVRHKSGLEPVFSKEQATDLAKMRRN